MLNLGYLVKIYLFCSYNNFKKNIFQNLYTITIKIN